MISNKFIWGCIGILGIGIGVRLASPSHPSPSIDMVTQTTNITHAPRLSTPRIKVQVSGEVQHPGIFTMEKGQRIQEAIDLAGGLTAQANDTAINYVGKLRDGQHIRVPSQKKLKKSPTSTKPNSQNNDSFDINTATSREISGHFSLSQKAARQIIRYRKEMGWIRTLSEITPFLPTPDRQALEASQSFSK